MFPKEPHYSALRGPWGLFSTLGLSAGIAAAYMGFQLLIGWLFIEGLRLYDRSQNPILQDINLKLLFENHEGLATSLGVLAATPIGIWLILYCIHRRRGPAPWIYLALKKFGLKQFVVWFGALAVLAFAGGYVSDRLGKQEPEVMLHVWRTAVVPPLLFLAVVVAGPIFEELFFRGFLYRGIEWSPLGRVGAIIITALSWALIHLQYDTYFIGQIFLMGILLGYARARTGSTLLTIVLHALNNLYSTIALYYLIGHGS